MIESLQLKVTINLDPCCSCLSKCDVLMSFFYSSPELADLANRFLSLSVTGFCQPLYETRVGLLIHLFVCLSVFDASFTNLIGKTRKTVSTLMLFSQVNCMTANQNNDQDLQENLKTINPIMIIRFSCLIISWKAVVLRYKKKTSLVFMVSECGR